MDAQYYDDKTFEDIDVSATDLRDREYVSCEFLRYNFEKADLTETVFMDCRSEERRVGKECA